MRFNTLAGTIERRLLINYRVDPEAIRQVLPSLFRDIPHIWHARPQLEVKTA